MNRRTDFFARFARAAVLLLAAMLSACGPGSGGTGTGPVMGLVSFSGTVLLGTGTGSPSTPGTGIGPGGGTPVDLQLQETAVEFGSACGRFVFTGEWRIENGLATLPGRFDAVGRPGVPATLQLQFADGTVNSPTVTATVIDAAGVPLLGPVMLQRTPAPAAIQPAAGCT